MAKRGAVPTSQGAAGQVQAKAATLRAAALEILKGAPDGLTADEVATRLQASVLAIRPRISELNRMGLILPTAIRRRNTSGLRAAVWVSV